jgi:hypothetical protein
LELQRVLENIADENTKAKAIRTVTLTLRIKPEERPFLWQGGDVHHLQSGSGHHVPFDALIKAETRRPF